MNRLISIILAIGLIAVGVLAQSNTGRLVGVISGPDGTLPGASIEITDNKTGKTRTVVANEDGNFSIPQLEVGTYNIKVTATGFKTFTATDLKIDVGKDYSFNPTLEVGGLNENVTVVAGADIINATNAELTNTVSPQQIIELPLVERAPLDLIQLQAGTSNNSAHPTTINGLRSSFSNITRDGLNIQDNYIRQNAIDFVQERPNVEDTGEFTITTQNAGADRGYGSVQVQLVTPRGQQKFHGALYEYNRNSKFAANTFFNNSSGIEKSFLNRNIFGGKLGGPLPVPTFGEGGPSVIRDKAFFFVSYDGYRLRESSSELRRILLPSARNGIFTYRDNAGVTRTLNILSPSLGTGITSIDPTIQSRILSRLPTAGNSRDIGDGLNTTGYRFDQKANRDRDSFTTRIDFDINQRHSINGVFSYKSETNLRPDADEPQGFNTTPVIYQPSKNKFLALAYRHVPSAVFTNEIRGGLMISKPTFNRSVAAPDFFIVNPTLNNLIIPQGGIEFVDSPEVRFLEQGRFPDYYNIQDNAEYFIGNHSLRFGGLAQIFRINSFADAGIVPTYTLGNSGNSDDGSVLTREQFPGGISNEQLTTANNLLSLLGGIIGNASQSFNATGRTSGFVSGATQEQNFEFENYALYVSDQWRVAPQLTLNLGLRYELFTALREKNGLALEPVIPRGTDPVAAILNPNGRYDFIGGNAGKPNQYYKADTDNFAPVFSFAYAPKFQNSFLGNIFGDGRTVIRGGFRVSYVNDELIRSADNASSGNDGLQSTVSRGELDLNGRFSNLPSIPTPEFIVPRTYRENFDLDSTSAVFAIDPDLQAPMVLEYNFGIQRELGFQTAIEIRYVGGHSNNLVRGVDYNQLEIRNNGFLADFNRARQNLLLATAQRQAEAARGVPTSQLTPLTGDYQARVPGSQQLTVFPRLELGGLLSNSTIRSRLLSGEPAALAQVYFTNYFGGSEIFAPNPNIFVADLLQNSGKYRYHSLQAEVRRRFSKGLYLQGNYTFQKTLTNAVGTNQTRFEPLLDNRQPNLEYSRADYDQTHVFNFNAIYELPFGRNRRFLNQNGLIDKILGGFQLNTIIRAATGAPISIVDPRGTLNRAGRSTRQTANSSLTKDQIKDLVGVYRTPCGVYYINPAVINLDPKTCQGSAAGGYGSTPFNGQVFFNVAPGETGNLERNFIDGPLSIRWDLGLSKTISITENTRIQLRAEAYNILNRANFGIYGPLDTYNQQNSSTGIFSINSPNFGRLVDTEDPRIMQFAVRFEF
jgi:hypothetical protein